MIDGVHIWSATLDDPGWPGPAGLPADERRRAGDFLRETPARRWVASRWALRRVLGNCLGIAPATIRLEVNNGKPRLAAGNGLEFNLSHSGGLALIAVAGCAVGIDVEMIKPDRDLVALAERALPAAAAAGVRAAPGTRQAVAFYEAWTRHEAHLKCLGIGIGSSPSQAPVAVQNIDVAPGYAAAVAVAGAEVGPVLCRSLFAG